MDCRMDLETHCDAHWRTSKAGNRRHCRMPSGLAAENAFDWRQRRERGLWTCAGFNVKVRIPYFDCGARMLAKLTSKNQLTLPKSLVQAVGASDYFNVELREGQLILTPVRIQRADAVRAKLAELDLTDRDIAAAVAWARTPAQVNEPAGTYRVASAQQSKRATRAAKPKA